MKQINHNVRLTSAEIANLWSQYLNDSMAICVIKYYLQNVQDADIQSILEFSLDLSQRHLEKIKEFLDQENYPIPKGFTEEDVTLDAPPLFADSFLLIYMHIMTIHGLTGYAGAVSTSIREDQVNYFIQCNTEALELYKRIIQTLVHKGMVSRPPNINAPETIDFVERKSFLTGWFGDRRPLNAIEVGGLFFNSKKNAVKIVLELGFKQVANSKELRDYFQKGENLCDKHFDTFSAILSESELSSPNKYGDQVTSSTISPFSDKLLLFHITSLVATAAGYYGAAFSLSQRRDLATKYAILIAEVTKYAEDGVKIMINKGWLEQPPTFTDHNKLAKRH